MCQTPGQNLLRICTWGVRGRERSARAPGHVAGATGRGETLPTADVEETLDGARLAGGPEVQSRTLLI